MLLGALETLYADASEADVQLGILRVVLSLLQRHGATHTSPACGMCHGMLQACDGPACCRIQLCALSLLTEVGLFVTQSLHMTERKNGTRAAAIMASASLRIAQHTSSHVFTL